MKKDCNKSDTLYAPRSFGIIFLQLYGLLIIVIDLLTTFAVAFSDKLPYSNLAILLGAITLPGFAIGFLMIYFPHKYKTLLVYQHDTKLLSKIKKGTASQEFALNNAKLITSNKLIAYPASKYYLTIETNTDRNINIFQEDIIYGFSFKHWEAFAEKLARITGLPLKKEYFVERFDGTLVMSSVDELKEEQGYNFIILSIPIIISLIGAGIYRVYGTTRVFFYTGCVTVAINILLSFAYLLLNRQKLKKSPFNIFVLVILYLTLSIPYAIFYVLVCFILNGFRLPL